MKNTLILFFLILFSLSGFTQNFQNLHFGSDSTLDIVTWNTEWFPKNGQTTINYVKDIILSLEADVIAFQEIDNKNSFQQLINALVDYDGYYYNDDYQGLAYIYKKSSVQVTGHYEIYTNNSREFPRSPFVLEIKFQNQKYVLINNHLKCCGDGNLNPYDDWDEETRRLEACRMLDQYISQYFFQDKVLVMGDWNDELTDREIDNIFPIFLQNPSEYAFADMSIAEGASAGWSYPSWPSHLDHILISSELFGAFSNPASQCQVIRLEEYFSGGWNSYDYNVTDHRPVGIRLSTNGSTGLDENLVSKYQLQNFPNPFQDQTQFTFAPAPKNSQLLIYSSRGQVLESNSIAENQTSFVWKASDFVQGVYYASLVVNGKTTSWQKLILLK